MILLLDNYDSFSHNLARYFRLLGEDVRIETNDALTLDDIASLAPAAIVLSPGPCAPAQAGICVSAIQRFGNSIPMLGVCLGHQCINEAYGGQTVRSPRPMHGRASVIAGEQSRLYDGLPKSFSVGRYHSLCCALSPSSPLRVTSRAEDGVIMSFEHESHPVFGVQYHPESILTEHGSAILANFLKVLT